MKFRHRYNLYSNRDERNKFISKELKNYLGNSVLNISGGGKKYLKKYLDSKIEYIETDIANDPDYIIDLEKDLPFKFSTNRFSCVIATDVLEHIENPNEVFEEMVRISNDYIIISLPNCWETMKTKIFKNSSNSGCYYGFPTKKPVDRHKWFFNTLEAQAWYISKAKEFNLEIIEIFDVNYYHKDIKRNILRKMIHILFGENVRRNMFSGAIWCIFKKVSK